MPTLGGVAMGTGGKVAILLFLIVSSMTAAPVSAIWGVTHDVVLSDTGPRFYDTETVGIWPYYYTFTMRGEVESYSTSWYSGSGHTKVVFLVIGVYYLEYASVRFSNTQGFTISRTYSQASFTGSFFYPFLDDGDGGPRSKLKMIWHYKLVGGGTF